MNIEMTKAAKFQLKPFPLPDIQCVDETNADQVFDALTQLYSREEVEVLHQEFIEFYRPHSFHSQKNIAGLTVSRLYFVQVGSCTAGTCDLDARLVDHFQLIPHDPAKTKWHVAQTTNPCGHYVVRFWDATPNGNTDQPDIATFYDEEIAHQFVDDHNKALGFHTG